MSKLKAIIDSGIRSGIDKPQPPRQMPDEAARQGIRAYHGSPYSFDEFSTSQIGTGEGAQAYGRGLYFAEAENVAKGYRDQLSEGLGTVDGESIGGWAAEILDNSKGDPSALRARINMAPDDFWVMNFEEGIAAKDNLLGVVDRLESGVSTWRPGGHMYEVDIDATPDDFLDYDKPLSEQSDRVKEALGIKGQQNKLLALQEKSNELQALYDKALSNVPSNPSFDDLFGDSAALRSQGELLTEKNRIDEEIKLLTTPKDFQLGDRKIPIRVQDYFSGANLIQGQGAASEISKQLLDKGIKGIKYLDQGSRPAGKGTSNYVVFDDKLISIAKKYGISIPAAAAVLAGTMTPEEAQAGPLSAAGRAAQKGFTKDVYHGTTQDFDQVDPDAVDLGIHVGTPAQAANRLRDTTGNRFSGSYDEGANIMPLKARMNNTLEMEDAGDWKDSYQVLGSLRNTPVGRKNRAKIQEMEEQADEIMGQYAYGDEEWRDSPENRELLDEINTMLADSGYDSIRYKNQVENTYGSSAGLTPQAEQRKAAISKEINALDRKLYARKPDMPAMDDPDLAAKMDAFLSFDANKERTPADAARRQQLLDENMAISEDPANQADTNSYIILDPDANLRSRNAKFMDERGNLLASVGTGLGVAVAAGSAPEAQAGVISIPTQGIRSLGQTLEFDPRFDPRKREQEGLQSLQFDFLPRNEAMIKPSLRLSDLEGEDFVTSMSDRTRAGGMIMGINGVPLYRAVDLRGGQDFMFENPNQVWASARVPSEKILEMAREFQGQSGKDPLFIPWRMAPTGGDFSNMVGELMLGFASSNMDKATKKAFDVAIREYKTKGSMDKGVRKNAGLKIKEWPGVDDPKAVEIWRSTPDAVRKELMNMMDVQFRNKGGLSIGSARLVASDPTQLMSRDAGLQNVGRIYTGQDITPSTHPSYPYAVPGEGIGTLKGADEVTIFDLLPEARFGDAQKKVKDPANPTQQEIRALQMKPYGGTITENILRRIEERGVNVNSLTGLTPGALAFTLTSAGLLTPEEAAAGGLDEAAEIFSGTKGGKGVTSAATPDEVAFKAPREPRRIPEKQPPGIASLAGQLGLDAMSEIGGAILGGAAGLGEYVRGGGLLGVPLGEPATAESIRDAREGVAEYVGGLYDAGPEAQELGQEIMQNFGETVSPFIDYAMRGDITDEYGINMVPLIAQKLGIPAYELLERLYYMMPEREQEAAKSGSEVYL